MKEYLVFIHAKIWSNQDVCWNYIFFEQEGLVSIVFSIYNVCDKINMMKVAAVLLFIAFISFTSTVDALPVGPDGCPL